MEKTVSAAILETKVVGSGSCRIRKEVWPLRPYEDSFFNEPTILGIRETGSMDRKGQQNSDGLCIIQQRLLFFSSREILPRGVGRRPGSNRAVSPESARVGPEKQFSGA